MLYDLNDFKKLKITSGLPSISITQHGLTFNKNSIIKLEEPEHVDLLVDEQRRVIAVVKSQAEDAESMPFLKAGKKVLSVRWNNKDLIEQIGDMMGWNLSEEGYRVQGIYDREQSALFFDLTKARRM